MFTKAQKQQGRLRVAITGPSGSGKTFSALTIATGIGERIAVIDTENGSAADYADRFQFDIVKIDPPYTIQKYREAMEEAYGAGYDVLIVDSISHAWAGEGGLLDKKDTLDSRGGKQNQFGNWGPITKEHEAFKSMLLNNPIHLVATMRSKQDYVLDQGPNGKTTPRKVGMAPIQRDGMEYEFTLVLDMGMDHSAQVSKDRTGIFDGNVFTPTKKTGEKLLKWRMDGLAAPAPKAETPAAPATDPDLISKAQQKRLFAIANEAGVDAENVKAHLIQNYDIDSTSKIKHSDYEVICEWIQAGGQSRPMASDPADAALEKRVDDRQPVHAGAAADANMADEDINF